MNSISKININDLDYLIFAWFLNTLLTGSIRRGIYIYIYIYDQVVLIAHILFLSFSPSTPYCHLLSASPLDGILCPYTADEYKSLLVTFLDEQLD